MTTPPETSANGTALSWTDPQHITIAVASSNLNSDASQQPVFTDFLSTQEQTLLAAAAHVWEIVANVKFDFVPDNGDIVPDIRVGLSDLNPMGFIGYTSYHWNGNANFLPDTLLAVEDPSETPTITTPEGNLRYSGFTTTMFQDFEHELGHALGLGHNKEDVTAIMNPIIGSKNPLPNAQDVAGIQAIYGPPIGDPVLSVADITTLHNLLSPA